MSNKKMQEEDNTEADKKEIEKRVYANIFSFERLHQLMLYNDHQMLGFFDALSLLYELIANKGKNHLDRKVFLTLYNGGEWTRDYICQSTLPEMPSTCLNLTAFIQPKYIVKQLAQDDTDGFNDRFFYICPPEKDPFYQELKLDAIYDPTFYEVFTLSHRVHFNNDMNYQFSTEASWVVQDYYNNLVNRKAEIKIDKNRRGVLSKSRGQFMRLCMVKQATKDALFGAKKIKEEGGDLFKLEYDDCDWASGIITKETAKESASLMDYLICHQFALMPPEFKIDIESQSRQAQISPLTDITATLNVSSSQDAESLSMAELDEH